MSESAAQVDTPQLTAAARTTAMLATFLGWMCAGMEMSLMVWLIPQQSELSDLS